MEKATCSCGKIEIIIEGEPANTCFCYCSECQKLTGSDKGFVAHFPEKSVSLSKGSPSKFSRMGSSGKRVTYSFCSTCGSMVFGKAETLPFVSVPVPRLENPNNYQPKMAIYTASAPSWAVFNNEIPNFKQGPA
ncbi:hypothetical protein LCGC14_2794870 [marine sediment metagenome]|uniref:CENP-V/GFA domain-containing protein n=1 Tax=marine sediment metagenome TaxID=412755 RepID=A0A0F9AY29_9ZZZZ